MEGYAAPRYGPDVSRPKQCVRFLSPHLERLGDFVWHIRRHDPEFLQEGEVVEGEEETLSP